MRYATCSGVYLAYIWRIAGIYLAYIWRIAGVYSGVSTGLAFKAYRWRTVGVYSAYLQMWPLAYVWRIYELLHMWGRCPMLEHYKLGTSVERE